MLHADDPVVTKRDGDPFWRIIVTYRARDFIDVPHNSVASIWLNNRAVA